MAKLCAPDGTLITATRELIPGTCDLNPYGDITRNADGTLDFEWCGETEIDWDGQETVEENGERIFIDENGGELREDEDDEDED